MKKCIITLSCAVLLVSLVETRLSGQVKYEIHPKSLDFGPVQVGDSIRLKATIKSTDVSGLMVYAINSSSSMFIFSPGNGIVDPYDSLKINITFKPVSAGLRSERILFTLNTSAHFDTVRVSGTGVGPDAVDNLQPTDFFLFQNFPNPVHSQSTIRFTIPERQWAAVSVYDALGREVRVLAQGVYGAGEHLTRFEAMDLPNGVYTYVLRSGNITLTKKAVVAKLP
jgi:hypothetical protein